MTPSFFIDNRERALLEDAEIGSGIIQCVPLDIGDFQIRIEDTIKYIFERKTIADLNASIKDGRYHEQKNRALAIADARFIYIIEGKFEFSENTNENKILSSSIINSSMRDGIPCIFTGSVKETAVLIKQIVERVTKDPAKYANAIRPSSNDAYTACATAQAVHTKKKDNMDKNAVLMIQLAAVPGISYKKAKGIVDCLGVTSISDLCDKLKGMTHKEFAKQADGIGKVLAKSIYEFCGINP
jgi:crossover junction endonuclease MUS81